MRFLILLFLIFSSSLCFSQGSGIRVLDTVPTYTPNVNRHSVVVFNKTAEKYYFYQDDEWKVLPSPDSLMTILGVDTTLTNKLNNLSQLNTPFLFPGIDSVYINSDGELLAGDTTDQGDYNLQVKGYIRINDGSAITTVEDATIIVNGVAANAFVWVQLIGEQGSEVDINGNQQNATLGLFNNTANWSLNNNITGGHLDIEGTVGDFRVRTSSNVYPLTIKDNAINGAFTIKASGVLNSITLPTYADDTAAGAGGLVTGDIYKVSTGELRIKL